MPLLDHTKLQTRREILEGQLQLTVIAHAYVWQDKTQNLPKVLPAQIAIPWYNLSEELKIKPILSFPNYAQSNWDLIDPNE